MRTFAMVGANSGELLTFNGLVLVHDNKDELEYIMAGVRVVDCPEYVQPQERMSIKQHPDMAPYRWPLQKNDLR